MAKDTTQVDLNRWADRLHRIVQDLLDPPGNFDLQAVADELEEIRKESGHATLCEVCESEDATEHYCTICMENETRHDCEHYGCSSIASWHYCSEHKPKD